MGERTEDAFPAPFSHRGDQQMTVARHEVAHQFDRVVKADAAFEATKTALRNAASKDEDWLRTGSGPNSPGGGSHPFFTNAPQELIASMAGNQYLMSTPTQLHLAAARLADGTSTVSMGWFLFLVDLFTRRPDGCDGLACLPADGTALWYVDGDHSLHDGYIEPTRVRLTRDGAGGRITSLTVPGCGTIDFEYDGDETWIPSAASGFDTASRTPDTRRTRRCATRCGGSRWSARRARRASLEPLPPLRVDARTVARAVGGRPVRPQPRGRPARPRDVGERHPRDDTEADRSPGWISATERCPVCEKCLEPLPVLDGVELPPEPTCESSRRSSRRRAPRSARTRRSKKFASTKGGAPARRRAASPCPKVCRDEWKKCAAKCTSDSKCGKTGKKTKLSKKCGKKCPKTCGACPAAPEASVSAPPCASCVSAPMITMPAPAVPSAGVSVPRDSEATGAPAGRRGESVSADDLIADILG